MKKTNILFEALALILAGLLSLSVSYGEVTKRGREPIVISLNPSVLPDWVDQGASAQLFELWAFENSQWRVIPFQIDQFKPIPTNLVSYLFPCGSGCVCRSAGEVNQTWRGPCEREYYLRGTALPNQPLSSGDELVFMAGDAGECDAPLDSWPDSGLALSRQRITIWDSTDYGCVYLFLRPQGPHPPTGDYVSYDEFGDGVSHNQACLPSPSACGAIMGWGFDASNDGTLDSPPYRLDFLGNWAADKLYIGNTNPQPPVSDSLIDLLKYRIDNPTETEGIWDIRNNSGGCAIFHGFIDGPVRVIRVIQGAASGATTTKYEFAYPSEIRFRVNLRVHDVPGPIYQYFDIKQGNLGGVPPPTVFKSGSANSYDVIDGVDPASTVFGEKDWYQVSSSKGSFVSIPNLQITPTSPNPISGTYRDSSTPLWNSLLIPEYDSEVGDRAAARPGIVTCLCDSQDKHRCRPQEEDPFLAVAERTVVMLKSGFADSSKGQEEIDNRARGVFSSTIEKQNREPVPLPQPTPPPCVPDLTPEYANDGGDVTLRASLGNCVGSNGWNLYYSIGAGRFFRLASLGNGVAFRDKALRLNESRTYYARARGVGGVEGSFSTGATVVKTDLVPPSQPQSVTAIATYGNIEVSWGKPVEWDVQRHQIMVSNVPGGQYGVVATGGVCNCGTSVTFSAVGPATYYLKVVAIDQAGNQSVPSEELRVDVP